MKNNLHIVFCEAQFLQSISLSMGYHEISTEAGLTPELHQKVEGS